MPEFNEANKELANNNQVVLFAINTFEDEATGREFIHKNNYDMNFLFDPKGEVAELYQVTGIPTTIVIGLDGTIQDVQVGSTNKEYILNHPVLEKIKTPIQDEKKLLEFQVDSKTFSKNGSESLLDLAPVILNGRTLIPVRAFVEAVGGDVKWDSTEGRVDLIFMDKKIQIWVNSKSATIDGSSMELDVPVNIMNNRAMIPLRFVMENFGFKVFWNESLKTITIEG